MLVHLRVTNVALIAELAVDFDGGLNVLSGETGAGKSILIDALHFVLGGRVGKSFIRSGSERATVEALFHVDRPEPRAALAAADITLDEDDALLIARSVTETGKSACRINGRAATLGMLKELTPFLIDLHGQHEHQSLLDQTRHIQLVDQFCPAALAPQKTSLLAHYNQYKEMAKQISAVMGDETDRQRTLELLAFQIREIEDANLRVNEEETLAARRTVAVNAEKLADATKNAFDALQGEGGATDQISRALKEVQWIAQLDAAKQPLAETVADLFDRMQDVAAELRAYDEAMEHNPQEIEQIETRLDLIYSLKRKYGASIEAILAYYDTVKSRYDYMYHNEETVVRLSEQQAEAKKRMVALCKEMSLARKTAAVAIEAAITAALRELGMKDARFEICFEQKDTVSLNGFDRVAFYIAANAGEEPKPLAETASGGEMSRVMLAMKTVLAEADPIGTFVFDEIDTGVSGRTAQKLAEQLAALAVRRQLLCVTHLPQIAAMADCHFLIEKNTADGRTTTTVTHLDDKRMIDEIARLIGGAQITATTREAAAEMKRMAVHEKGLKRLDNE